MKSKIIEWLNRYLSAEVFSLIGVLFLGTLVQLISHNSIFTAVAGTLGENVGFYGNILYKDIQKRKKRDHKLTFMGMLKVVRNAAVEFGLAEYLDLIIRPSLMYFFQQAIHNTQLALLVAKFSADITFYSPAILFYEIRKKFLKD